MRQRDIFFFWLPLFSSWLLMTAEGPLISAVINRLPDEVVMLAAMGIVNSLSVTIESPIINLLATSTALARDYSSYRLIRKFTIHWMILLSIIAALLAYTSLFDLIVVDLMAIPADIAVWIRPGMQIMVFWSAAIGWRRFHQGVLIRFNKTRSVAVGTVIRLISSGGTVIIMATTTDYPGVVIGSSALMAGVISEALYATFASRSIIKGRLREIELPPDKAALTYKRLFLFHLPLALTSLLILLVQPMVSFSLARLPDPTLSLAAWPIVFQVLLVSRAPAFALPEVVISLAGDKGGNFAQLRKFAWILVGMTTALFVLLIITPLLDFYLTTIQDATESVAAVARSGVKWFLLLPALTVIVSWLRGLLINEGATKHVNLGMLVNVMVTVLVLGIGLLLQSEGIAAAGVALSSALLLEVLYIWYRTNQVVPYRFQLLGFRGFASTQ